MEILHIVMLFAAGIAGGILSGLIGGASLVTFPALLAAGLPPITAAVTNLFALVPANTAVVITERALLPPLNRAFFGLLITTSIGAAIGASLLLITPGRTFEVLVPVLLGFATVLLAYSQQITVWFRERSLRRGKGEPHLGMINLPMLPISIYGGYFGGGLGVIVLGVLSLATGGEYRSANVIKNVIIGISTSVAALVFVSRGAVSWPPTLVMMAGAVVGGLLAGQLARVVPPAAMRVAVVAMGVMLTVAFAWRYWF